MLNRNAAAPWFYAAGGVMLGLAGFKAASMLKRRERSRVADVALEPSSSPAALQHSGENAAQQWRRAPVPDLLDEELEAALSGSAPPAGEAYDAVAPDDLASEWLARATETAGVVAADEPLDTEVAELLRDAGMSLVGEATLNSASPEQIEVAAEAHLEGYDDQFELEFDKKRRKFRK